jgi:hypothetical protein
MVGRAWEELRRRPHRRRERGDSGGHGGTGAAPSVEPFVEPSVEPFVRRYLSPFARLFARLARPFATLARPFGTSAAKVSARSAARAAAKASAGTSFGPPPRSVPPPLEACASVARRLRFGGRRVALGAGVAAVLCAAGGLWVAAQARQARTEAARMQVEGERLRRELAAYDLAAAGATLGRLREHSARAHGLTDDPVWAVAGVVPYVGRDLRAARETSAVLADVTQAARPLESALPRLDPSSRESGATVDVVALADVARAVPGLAVAVGDGAARLSTIDPDGLRPQLASGVVAVRSMLDAASGPLAGAEPLTRTLPAMLGATGARTWVVLLQQNAEARGTGGLVGAYAVLRSENGTLSLVQARSRSALDRGPAVPVGGVPEELRELWGRDLQEWAGLNLSPNFPWTGRLVADGWAADGRRGRLDYVAGVDAHVVAALLAGTGPVRLRDGTAVTQANAVDFLSRGVYAKHADPAAVDAVTTDLVGRVFARVSTGKLDLPALVRSMATPVEQRRLLVWSARPDEQRWLQRLPVGGALPTEPGAWAMAVVNNGGGNKLDAYLKVHTTYSPGVCAQGQRVGRIVVDVRNTAPRSGLPGYVTVRSDVIDLARRGIRRASSPVVGSNRVLLDIYGPVASQAAMVAVDGRPVTPVSGTDAGHAVSRVAFEVDPGAARRVELVLVAPAVPGDAGTRPTVQVQPMVHQPTVSTEPLTPCAAVPRSG